MQKAYLGIDVSKGYADFTVLDENKSILEDNFQLNDTHRDHQKLIEILNSLASNHQLKEIYAALESTGGYENNWLALLKETKEVNIKIARLNPYGIKHDSQAQLKRTITDSVSARQIAEYIIRFPDKVNYEGDNYNLFNSLRSQYKYIKTLVKQKSQLLNQLEKRLYYVYPELLTYCKDEIPNWAIHLLSEFPTANTVKNASIKELKNVPYISENKAREIKNKASKTVSRIDDPVIQFTVQHMAKEIIFRKATVQELKKQLEKNAENHDLVNLLCSFQGIGIYSAVGILIEIEDINRFPSSKKICSFFGVHPVYKKSGDGTFYKGMSKQGASEIRGILYMVAKSALVYNPHIRSLYDKFKSKGFTSHQAMGVLIHKILRIIYGMLKNNTPYNPGYDLQCQQKNIAWQKQQDDKEKYRYTSNDQEAPISNRKAKKRKEQHIAPNSS
jgi:transposase